MAASILPAPSISRFKSLLLHSFMPRLGKSSLTSLLVNRSFASLSLKPCPTVSTRSVSGFSFSGDLVMLGIETSCDDTAAAVVRGDGQILSQVVSSQEDLLVKYGGVSPKMAEEAHALAIDQVVQQALDNANLTEENLSAVAVTIGPGLSLCLKGVGF